MLVYTLSNSQHIPSSLSGQSSYFKAGDHPKPDFYTSSYESIREPSLSLFIWRLNDNQEEIFVWGDEDLLALGAHSEERQVVHWVDVAHHRASFLCELGHLLSILLWRGIVICGRHCRSKELAILVDNQKALDAFMVLDAANTFFYLCHDDVVFI